MNFNNLATHTHIKCLTSVHYLPPSFLPSSSGTLRIEMHLGFVMYAFSTENELKDSFSAPQQPGAPYLTSWWYRHIHPCSLVCHNFCYTLSGSASHFHQFSNPFHLVAFSVFLLGRYIVFYSLPSLLGVMRRKGGG